MDSTPRAVLPRYDEPSQPAESTIEHLPMAPWEAQPSGSLPPPSKYGERHQFFDQQWQQTLSCRNSGECNGLVAQAQNLSLNQWNDSLNPAAGPTNF